MLDYKTIAKTIQNKNYSLKYFIPRVTEMTVQGFKLALKKKILKVKTLEEISKALDLKMSYWWENDDPGNIMNEAQGSYTSSLKKEIEGLASEHKKDQETIGHLNKYISTLEEKIAKKTKTD